MKHRILRALALLLLLTTLLPLAACGGGSAKKTTAPKVTTPPAGVTVMLVIPEGAATADTLSVTVAPGGTATFHITVAEGYEYVGNDKDAVFESGVLTLTNVRFPTTVTLDIREKEIEGGPVIEDPPIINFDALDWFYAAKGGSVSSTVSAGTYPKDTEIRVTATAEKGYTFLGWSSGDYLVNQGTLVSTSASYSFVLEAPTRLYANFKSEGEAIIRYHLNGGSAKGTDSDIYWQSFPLDYYIYPNTVADLGTFTREGYSLLEYTAEQNGGGYVTNPGGKVFLPTDGVIDLWVQWSKWSDEALFETSRVSGGLAITRYTGSESTVSIPQKIGGTSVVAIEAGAFNALTSMQTLVIPKTVTTIKDGAVTDCTALTTLYLCDSVRTVSNASFVNSPFRTFCYNAATSPSFSNYWGAYSRKFERVISLYGKANSLVVFSGSSSLYAIDSPYMMELLGKAGLNYEVCNLGIQASISQPFCVELLTHFLDEGDMVIHAPENSAVTNNLSEILIEMMESFYNGFRYVDMRNYTNLFTNIAAANKTRASWIKTAYTDSRSNISIYGDWIDEFKNVNFAYSGSTSAGSSAPTMLNRLYTPLSQKGVKVYFTFAPVNGGIFKSTEAQCRALESKIDSDLLAPRISVVLDYVLDPIYMGNSNAHTNDLGADLRTERLVRDILAQLAKEGQ